MRPGADEQDVPSPIDLRKQSDAAEWVATADSKRPWRADVRAAIADLLRCARWPLGAFWSLAPAPDGSPRSSSAHARSSTTRCLTSPRPCSTCAGSALEDMRTSISFSVTSRGTTGARQCLLPSTPSWRCRPFTRSATSAMSLPFTARFGDWSAPMGCSSSATTCRPRRARSTPHCIRQSASSTPHSQALASRGSPPTFF